MKPKCLKLATGVLLCAAAVTAAATYTWTDGQAQNNEWDRCDNWYGQGLGACFPSTSNDDAIIPSDGSPWTLDLKDEEIDDLSIQGSADLDIGSGNFKTLETDSVLIGSSSGDVIATVVGVKIITG